IRFWTTFLTAITLAVRSKSILLCHGALEFIGDVSYSLYLIHWPIVCILNIIEIESWQKILISKLRPLFKIFILQAFPLVIKTLEKTMRKEKLPMQPYMPVS
ncbi:hypothetical protein PENTCL1PPCAC_15046, partial [Pristionchus entomophagus]